MIQSIYMIYCIHGLDHRKFEGRVREMLYIWIALVVVAIIVEVSTEQLVSIWFAIGGLAGIITAAFGLNPGVQIAIALVVTLLALALTRPFVKKALNFSKVKTNTDRYLNQVGIVTEQINNTEECGLVKVLGSVWSARSLDGNIIADGSEVKVIRIEGVRLIVESC